MVLIVDNIVKSNYFKEAWKLRGNFCVFEKVAFFWFKKKDVCSQNFLKAMPNGIVMVEPLNF